MNVLFLFISLLKAVSYSSVEEGLIEIPLEQVRVPLKHRKLLKNLENIDAENLHEFPLENHHDLIYIGRVRLGNNGRKTFRALFDSGSSDIWFVSSECQSKFCIGRPGYYLAAETQTSEQDHLTVLSYAAGQVSGIIVKDSIDIGGLKADNQCFVAASTVQISKYFKFKGIIGMSPRSAGHRTRCRTLMSSLTSQDQLQRGIFSLILYKYDDPYHDSYLLLGGTKRSLYQGSLAWIQNTNPMFWSIQVTRVGFGSTFGKSTGTAVIDSGTSYIFCPPQLLEGINALIHARKYDSTFWSVSCTDLKKMPIITMVVGDDIKIPLYASDYISRENGICQSQFLPMEHDTVDSRNPDWILGAAFLRAYYVAFDMDNSRIGIARFKHKSRRASA